MQQKAAEEFALLLFDFKISYLHTITSCRNLASEVLNAWRITSAALSCCCSKAPRASHSSVKWATARRRSLRSLQRSVMRFTRPNTCDFFSNSKGCKYGSVTIAQNKHKMQGPLPLQLIITEYLTDEEKNRHFSLWRNKDLL